MAITAAQLERYQREGFLVLEDFIATTTCDALRRRAEELVHEFDPREAISVFSTAAQNHLRDDYFLESGDKIRFFFEEDAFLPDGSLKQSKERSINKVGHAMVIPAIRKTTGSNVRPRCLSAVSTNIIPAR